MTISTTATSPIRYDDFLLTPPTLEPLDLEEVKKQRRFTDTSLDTLFDLWMGAARQQFEEVTGLQLLRALRCFALDACPLQSRIELGRAPVIAIESIVYDDAAGDEQTLDESNYRLVPPSGRADTYPTLGVVELVPGASWPTTGTGANALRINYWAGYGNAPGYVPAIIQHALMLYVGCFHERSEGASEAEYYQNPDLLAIIREAQGRTRRTVIPTMYSAWSSVTSTT